jgi:hypothetical protein
MVELSSSIRLPVIPKKRLLVIIKNHDFKEARNFLAKHKEKKDDKPKDLDKGKLDEEVASMKKFGEETLKAEVIVLD